jgi:hypothetical protein
LRRAESGAVQDSIHSHQSIEAVAGASPARIDDDRPPACPRCNRRFVILTSQWFRTAAGVSVRRQLWGCPRGHATAYRANGAFGSIEHLQDLVE